MVATETQFVLGGFVTVLSASGFGGLRWALTQLLLRNKKMGLDNPAATVFWLSPIMGVTLGVISAVVEDWAALFHSDFFSSFRQSLETVLFLIAPGILGRIFTFSSRPNSPYVVFSPSVLYGNQRVLVSRCMLFLML